MIFRPRAAANFENRQHCWPPSARMGRSLSKERGPLPKQILALNQPSSNKPAVRCFRQLCQRMCRQRGRQHLDCLIGCYARHLSELPLLVVFRLPLDSILKRQPACAPAKGRATRESCLGHPRRRRNMAATGYSRLGKAESSQRSNSKPPLRPEASPMLRIPKMSQRLRRCPDSGKTGPIPDIYWIEGG